VKTVIGGTCVGHKALRASHDERLLEEEEEEEDCFLNCFKNGVCVV
jgi:hypothetical protein